MKFLQLALTGAFVVITASTSLAQTTQTPGSSSNPANPSTPGSSAPSMTPGMSAPTNPAPGSASPPTMGALPSTRSDCAGSGWSRFSGQGFQSEADCVAWLGKQGK